MTCLKVPKNNELAISATNKTLADILGEMRNRADTVINGRAITERNFVPQETVEDWADRIEATFRNCDVGTLTEQQQRFHNFCEKMQHTDKACCGGCPIVHLRMQGIIGNSCELAWAQMPYEEKKENANESKP